MAQNFRHSEILTIAREAGKVTVEEGTIVTLSGRNVDLTTYRTMIGT